MSDLYQNSKVLYVERDEDIEVVKRDKDYFGNFENSDHEKDLFERIFSEFKPQITDSSKNNEFDRMINRFNEESISEFNERLNRLINNSISA